MSKVLVVDDSKFMRTVLKNILTQANYEVITEADNGEAAIGEYQKRRPDIVLLDIIMPVKDGLQALPELVRLGAKVIMVTAVGQEQMIKKALELGARDFILKPFNGKQVTDTIARVAAQ